MNPEERNYKAFISYRHKPLDIEVAKKLHRRIERYTIPKDLRKGGSDKLGLVFRDQDELPISDNLTKNIETALDNSEFLIVVCSKDTPESKWVQREITYFLEHHDRDHLLAILISGDPNQSFPRQLTEIRDADGNLIDEVEPLAANIVADTEKVRNRLFSTESLRILASLIGCPYDALYQREQRYKMWRLAIAAAVVVSVAAAFIGMLINRNAMIREQLNASMINESRALSALSDSAFRAGNYRQSLEYALDALPGRNPDRPYVAEAEAALSDRLYLYRASNSMKYKQSFEQDTDIRALEISADGALTATGDSFGNVNVYDTKTGRLLWSVYTGEGIPRLFFADDLLLICGATGNTAYTRAGEAVWSSAEEFILEVSGDTKIFLSYDYDLADNRIIFVKNLMTGELIRDLGTLGDSYYLPDIGAISPDGKYAAILISHADSKAEDLFCFDLTTGEHKPVEKDLINANLLGSYRLCFDTDGNLALAFTGDDDLLANYDYHDGSYLKLFSAADDWESRYTTALDFGTASRLENGNVDLSDYIDYFDIDGDGIVISARNRMVMANKADGSIRWLKDLPDRVVAARWYDKTELIALILQNGSLTFATATSGNLSSETGLANMECGYNVYGGALSGVKNKGAQFVIIPAQNHNLASVVTFSTNNLESGGFETPSWVERVPVRTRAFVTSPSGAATVAAYIDADNKGDYLLLDPADAKTPADLAGTDVKSYDLISDHPNMVLTDTGKMILCGRIFDFESGEVTGLTRSGEVASGAIIGFFTEGLYSSATSGVATAGDIATSEVITACVEKNEDNTFDLVIWKDAVYTGQSSRIPLDYEKLNEFSSYYCLCRAVSPTGYAVISAQESMDGAVEYWLYNINEDKWAEMLYFDGEKEEVFALAESHPWIALQKSAGELSLIDFSSGEQIRTVESTLTSASISKMIFTMDDRRLIVFTNSGSMFVFDTESGKEMSRSGFAEMNLRFRNDGRYEVHTVPGADRLLIIYDNMNFTESVAITIDTDSMEYTGVFTGISAYYPSINKVLVKEYRFGPCLSRFYTLEEMEQIAEEILQGPATSEVE